MVEQYNVSDFPDGAVDVATLNAEIEADSAITSVLIGVVAQGDHCYITFESDLTSDEKTALDGVVAAHSYLGFAKSKKFQEIDGRTHELIGQGFSYASSQFSLSLEAQSKMNGAYSRKSDSSIYPIVWNTLGDEGTFEIADQSALEAFYDAAFDTMKGHLDSGTSLKDQVRSATTVAEVEAVIDNR